VRGGLSEHVKLRRGECYALAEVLRRGREEWEEVRLGRRSYRLFLSASLQVGAMGGS
jgi:hypothetical protein